MYFLNMVRYKKTAGLFLVVSALNVSNFFAFTTPQHASQIIVNPLFMPVIYTGKFLPDNFLEAKPYQHPKLSDIDEIIPDVMQLDTPPVFEKELREKEFRRKAYLHLIMEDPSIVKYSIYDFPQEKKVLEPIKVSRFGTLFQVEANIDLPLSELPEKFMFRKYWYMNGNNLLQFSQNYISDNWYKGGVGNLNILSNQNIKINYEKEKIQFSTYLEWNTSLYTNPNDSLRQLKIGTDLLRTYSNFGIKAFKGWFYSSNMEIKTQVFNNYKENSRTIISSFASPLFVNIGIMGMRYELDKRYKSNKYKSLKISADFSPLSVKYSYVNDPKVDPVRYGIPQGEHYLFEFGSTINATMQLNVNRSTSFKSRFKYFSNYEKMEIESENEINFSINRYFSTRIYLYLRYDDGGRIPRDPKLDYIQVNELLSFGFNYKW